MQLIAPQPTVVTPLPPEREADWFSLDSVARIRGLSRRELFRDLDGLSSIYKRQSPNPSGRGRPQTLIHFSAFPDLTLHHRSQSGHPSSLSPQPSAETPASGVSADDLTEARLRLEAVQEYLETAKALPKAEALRLVASAWARRNPIRPVEIVERLPSGFERKRINTVSLGAFRPRTLRAWASAWGLRHELLDLAPARKGQSGRARKDIPEDLLSFVIGLASSTARADVAKALAKARPHWAGEWPTVSAATWRRRIAEADPEKVCASLGKGGISRFRAEKSPDADRSYSDMPFNHLWQLDDVTQDFYCHNSLDPLKVQRPFAYAIMRVATRQWISAVVCETPIVGDLVRALVGMALANPAGGMPTHIQFERGAVACDAEFEALLTTLGISVHRTSMDSGSVNSAALPDQAPGHFQGKAVIEANFRNLHNQLWDAPAQVGPEERHTKSARLDNHLAAARAAAKAGQPFLLPNAAQAMSMVFQAMERHNSTPHSGLPETIDAEGVKRHLSPNEYAAALVEQRVTTLPEQVLPLFFRRGVEIEVTKNGIRFEKAFYGRFDEAVQALAGTKVRVYGVKEIPNAVYVEQLGRCIERYVEPAWGEDESQLEAKRGIERQKRNLYEAHIAKAIEVGGVHLIEQTRFLPNPTPQRAATPADVPADLAALSAQIKLAASVLVSKREGLEAAWTSECTGDPQVAPIAPEAIGHARRSRSGRRGLLSREPEITAQVESLTLGITQTEESWKL
jgi:hypothetical protein